jgi:hypothetical protein
MDLLTQDGKRFVSKISHFRYSNISIHNIMA